jgi:ABC-type sugar transport system ATPase subunit
MSDQLLSTSLVLPPAESEMPPTYALEMDSIAKTFGGVHALRGVSLKVRRGEVHGLIGQNGAGKSTLMKILDGYYPAGSFSGSIRVAGAEVQLRSPRDAQAVGIAIAPQEITVVAALSVAENVMLGELAQHPGRLFGRDRSKAKAAKFLAENHLPLDPGARVATLSMHKQQLVMIARALYTKPQVLVLDEPTSSLTSDEIENLFAIVRSLRDNGLTCLFITHKLDEILSLCDRVTILRDGQAAGEYPRAEFDADRLITDMIGRKLGDLYPPRPLVAADAPEVLRVDGLAVENPRTPGTEILHDVSFTLRAGEILGLGGLVGSGRSELVTALYGQTRITRGEVVFAGRKIQPSDAKEAMAEGIGLVTEDRKKEGLLFNLNIRENVTLSILDEVSRAIVFNRGRERRLAKESLNALTVNAPSTATKVINLSGGNQQKVVIGKVLLSKPKVILLDEPTKGVDIAAKADIYRLMTDLAKTGVALILISSEFPELLALSHRVVVLAGGTVRETLDGASTSEERLMRSVMRVEEAGGAASLGNTNSDSEG